MTHTLKTDQPYFDAVRAGLKSFEVRFNDRDFQVGDTVILSKPNGDTTMTFKISYIMYGGQFGIDPRYVVFSLERA